jgi:hypothetical protein
LVDPTTDLLRLYDDTKLIYLKFRGLDFSLSNVGIKAWRERGDFLGDIAMIGMKPDHGKRIAHRLQALGIPLLLMATRGDKRAYDPRKLQVNILSVQSSKGLEFRSVIFIGLCQIETSDCGCAGPGWGKAVPPAGRLVDGAAKAVLGQPFRTLP